MPTLDQRQWDLVGLGLVAFAAFFACVFYLGWAGGQVGEALADALLFLFGGGRLPRAGRAVRRGRRADLRPMLPSGAAVRDRRALPGRRRSRSASPPARSGSARATRRATASSTPTTSSDHGGLVGRVALLGLEQALLGRRLAHPLRVPAAGRRAAADRARRSPACERARGRASPRTAERVRRLDQHARPADTRCRLTTAPREPATRSRVARAARARGLASRSCAPPTWRRPRSTASERYPDLYEDEEDEEPTAERVRRAPSRSPSRARPRASRTPDSPSPR